MVVQGEPDKLPAPTFPALMTSEADHYRLISRMPGMPVSPFGLPM